MHNQKIELQFSPGHFLEIYYAETKRSIFKNHPTKKALLLTASAAGFLVVVYLLSLQYDRISWLLVLGALAFIGCFIYTVVIISKHITWRNDIERYLYSLLKYKTFYLLLTDNYFEFGMDEHIELKKWESVKSVLFTSSYIQLLLNDSSAHIFPAKSMLPQEFENLKEFIKTRFGDDSSLFTELPQ
jgi:hypothetical protein